MNEDAFNAALSRLKIPTPSHMRSWCYSRCFFHELRPGENAFKQVAKHREAGDQAQSIQVSGRPWSSAQGPLRSSSHWRSLQISHEFGKYALEKILVERMGDIQWRVLFFLHCQGLFLIYTRISISPSISAKWNALRNNKKRNRKDSFFHNFCSKCL